MLVYSGFPLLPCLCWLHWADGKLCTWSSSSARRDLSTKGHRPHSFCIQIQHSWKVRTKENHAAIDREGEEESRYGHHSYHFLIHIYSLHKLALKNSKVLLLHSLSQNNLPVVARLDAYHSTCFFRSDSVQERKRQTTPLCHLFFFFFLHDWTQRGNSKKSHLLIFFLISYFFHPHFLSQVQVEREPACRYPLFPPVSPSELLQGRRLWASTLPISITKMTIPSSTLKLATTRKRDSILFFGEMLKPFTQRWNL